MKKPFFLLVLSGLLLIIHSTSGQYSMRQPDAIPLHGAWYFALDPSEVGAANRWYAADAPTNRWDQVTVPHCFSVDPRYQNFTGTAWYRRTFPWQPIPNKRVILHFDAVYYQCTIWLNDKKIGTHEGGYTPFWFDLTDQIQAGENTVAISVNNNTWRAGTVPGAKDNGQPNDAFPGWVNYGGIIRPVYLTVEPEVFLEKLKVETNPDLAKGTARLRVKAYVRNTSRQAVSPTLNYLVSRVGLPLFLSWQTRSTAIAPGEKAVLEAETTLKAKDVLLWTPDQPNLYTLQTVLAGDTLKTRFGIRKVEVRNAQLLLNGQPIRMAGGNRVVDYPGWGSMEPDWLIDKDLRLMKEAGMEFHRLTHYTPSEGVLDWADRNGMLIITEAGNWQLTPRQMDTDSIRANFRNQFREMAERDWNHPSVIAYSVGNEYLSETPSGQRWTKDMIAYARQLDSTRLCTFASMRLNILPKKPDDEASQYVDFVCTNTYGALAPVLDHIHQLYPNKPILISEYGRRADTETGEQGQVSYLEKALGDIRSRPYVVGASWWSFNDYQSRYAGTNSNGFRPWGLVQPDRSLRPLYQVHRREMAPITLEKVGWVPVAAGIHQLRLRLTARPDFPAYPIRGYRVQIAGYDALQPGDLQPGEHIDLNIMVYGFEKSVTVEVVKPTGFSILSQLIELPDDSRKSNR